MGLEFHIESMRFWCRVYKSPTTPTSFCGVGFPEILNTPIPYLRIFKMACDIIILLYYIGYNQWSAYSRLPRCTRMG